jgi:toxin ParE1/3/4
MAQVMYAAQARADIDDIWLAVAMSGGEELADRVIDGIEDRTAMLAQYPLMGPARPDIAEDARSLVVERWLVLYRAAAPCVLVMRVVDGARDLRHIKMDESAQ